MSPPQGVKVNQETPSIEGVEADGREVAVVARCRAMARGFAMSLPCLRQG